MCSHLCSWFISATTNVMFCLITPLWHFAFLNLEHFLPLYYLYVRLDVSFSYNYYVIISNAYSNSLFLCRSTQLKT